MRTFFGAQVSIVRASRTQHKVSERMEFDRLFLTHPRSGVVDYHAPSVTCSRLWRSATTKSALCISTCTASPCRRPSYFRTRKDQQSVLENWLLICAPFWWLNWTTRSLMHTRYEEEGITMKTEVRSMHMIWRADASQVLSEHFLCSKKQIWLSRKFKALNRTEGWACSRTAL